MLLNLCVISTVCTMAEAVWMIFVPLSWRHDLPAAIPRTGPLNAHFVRGIGLACALSPFGLVWCSFRRHSDILPGRNHWQIDAGSVFVPPVLLFILAIPAVRRRLGAERGL